MKSTHFSATTQPVCPANTYPPLVVQYRLAHDSNTARVPQRRETHTATRWYPRLEFRYPATVLLYRPKHTLDPKDPRSQQNRHRTCQVVVLPSPLVRLSNAIEPHHLEGSKFSRVAIGICNAGVSIGREVLQRLRKAGWVHGMSFWVTAASSHSKPISYPICACSSFKHNSIALLNRAKLAVISVSIDSSFLHIWIWILKDCL